VREERKLKLKLVVNDAVPVEVRVLPPALGVLRAPPRAGVAQMVEATAINLRLLLQTQHSPPIAESNGPVPMGVEMPVRLRPAELRSAVV